MNKELKTMTREIVVHNLSTNEEITFLDVTPEHAVQYCEAERVGLRSWYLTRFYNQDVIEIAQRLPTITGDKSISCGDFATLIETPEEEPEELTYRILSIDAWNNGEGWDWNDWTHVGDITPDAKDWTPRKLLKYFRDNGFLKDGSVGKCTVEDDQYNIVVLEKANRRPLYAVEYGNHD
jgi:hypothetical protein